LEEILSTFVVGCVYFKSKMIEVQARNRISSLYTRNKRREEYNPSKKIKYSS
jgi:hypothetical protein